MIKKIYSIYDSAAGIFHNPVFEVSEGTLLRGVMDALDNKQSELYKYRKDLSVFEIGEFDDNSGIIHLLKAPERKYYLEDLANKGETKDGEQVS
jgi:hypothetical protein